jgi:hypothetical protein
MVKKVWVRTLADRRWIRLLSINIGVAWGRRPLVVHNVPRRPSGECTSSPSLSFLCCIRDGLDGSHQQRVTVNATRSDLPTQPARAAARATQRQEQERAARAKESLEQYNEEYRLHE